jgi:hypothetical protein
VHSGVGCGDTANGGKLGKILVAHFLFKQKTINSYFF